MTDEMEMASTLVSVINKLFPWMTPKERVTVMADIGRMYCHSCGYELGQGGICHCENDE